MVVRKLGRLQVGEHLSGFRGLAWKQQEPSAAASKKWAAGAVGTVRFWLGNGKSPRSSSWMGR